MLDGINSKPLWHLLDSAILEIFEDAYQTHLKPYINLFGTAFVSCDKWNAQHKEYVAEIETKAGEWVESVRNTWEGHPKELSVLSQFLMRLKWVLQYHLFDNHTYGLSFSDHQLPLLSPMIIIDLLALLDNVEDALKWVCILN